MARPQITKAETVSVGDILPASFPGLETQVVSDVQHDGAKVVITTESGRTYVCAYGERLYFPRHESGLAIDWTAKPNFPTPRDLAFADILPPLDYDWIIDPRLEEGPHDDEFFQALHDFSLQFNNPHAVLRKMVISSFTRGPATGTVKLRLNTIDGNDRYTIYLPVNEPIRFPIDVERFSKPSVAASMSEGSPTRLNIYGPYVHAPTNDHVFFAAHPTGRGRWASHLHFDPNNIQHLQVTRPPIPTDFDPPRSFANIWSDWVYVGDGEPHPKDSTWRRPTQEQQQFARNLTNDNPPKYNLL